MRTENLTYNDVVVKTIEAMVVSGLKNTTVHGSYSKYYGMLGKYLDQRGIHHYDHDAIEEYLEIQEKRYRKKGDPQEALLRDQTCRKDSRRIRKW